jgi:hypothetical protein
MTSKLLPGRTYDADWLRDLVFEQGGWANIPQKSNAHHQSASHPGSINSATFPTFLNQTKCYRPKAKSNDKFGSSFLAMVKLACIRLRLRRYESKV